MADTLIADCYDSFTYNLRHAVEAILNEAIDVRRIDTLRNEDLKQYTRIIFSPGPGLPNEFGELIPLVNEAMRLEKHILGVCLGMQALALASGGALKNLAEVCHGISEPLSEIAPGEALFTGCSEPIKVGRYHSWVVDESRLPDQWRVTSRSSQKVVMSMQHREKPFCAIQFHPESVLTPDGRQILRNFLIR